MTEQDQVRKLRETLFKIDQVLRTNRDAGSRIVSAQNLIAKALKETP